MLNQLNTFIMKKLLLKFSSLSLVFSCFMAFYVNAQNTITLAWDRTVPDSDHLAEGGYTFPVGSPNGSANSKVTFINEKGKVPSASNSDPVCGQSDFTSRRRIQTVSFSMVVPISVSKIVINGASSGKAARALESISVDNVVISSENYTTVSTIEASETAATDCKTITIEGLNINAGKEIKVIFSDNVRIGTIVVTEASTTPLNFLSFTAKPHVSGKSVSLNWQTTNEVNTKEFIIEKRTDATEFKAIDTKASYNTSGVHNYSYTDNNVAAGKVYYRLKQVDKDGVFKYSDIAVADIKNGLSLSVYPNPTSDILNVEIGDEDTNELQVLNTNGQVVLSYKVVAGESSKSLNIASLKPGTYILQKIVNGSAKEAQKFIRQ